jgi:hypothetical protein
VRVERVAEELRAAVADRVDDLVTQDIHLDALRTVETGRIPVLR